MKSKRGLMRRLSWLLMVILAAPPSLIAQQSGEAAAFKQEELDQLLARGTSHKFFRLRLLYLLLFNEDM